MFPGLGSAPKYAGFSFNAFARFVSNEARPSKPTIGLESVTCMPRAIFCVVSCDSPVAIRHGWCLVRMTMFRKG